MTLPKYLAIARILSEAPADKAMLMKRTGWSPKIVTNSISQLMRRNQCKSDQPPGRKSRQAKYRLTVTIESIESGVGLPLKAEDDGVPLLEQMWPVKVARQVAEIGAAGG